MQKYKQSSSIRESNQKYSSYTRHAITQISMYGSTQVQPPPLHAKCR